MEHTLKLGYFSDCLLQTSKKSLIASLYILSYLMYQQNRKKESQSPYENQNTTCSSEDSIQRLRNTMRNVGLKRTVHKSDILGLRNSFSTVAIRCFEPPVIVLPTTPKKNTVNLLKSTLDALESKINSAKMQLEIKPEQIINMPKTKKYLTLDIDEDVSIYEHEPLKLTESNLLNGKGRADESIITQKKGQISQCTLVTSYPKPAHYKMLDFNPYSPRKHNHYYISEVIRAVNQRNSLAMQHITSSIKILKACQTEEIPQNIEIQHRKLSLKKRQYYRKKKTLLLDLDETLIHCNQNYEIESDIKLDIKIDQKHTIKVGVNIRPYALSFLKRMAAKFQIIIFTASHQSYADVVLDYLDPDNQIFEHRLYRQHCYVLENQLHVKDLRIINRNMSEMVLVDNAAYSYAFQLENGIPILPFYEGKDYELTALESYLQKIDQAHDVREVNKKLFKLHNYTKYQSGEQLVKQLYSNHFTL